MRKRNLILFGAGAARSWDGPSTTDITQILTNRKESKSMVSDFRILRIIHDFLVFMTSHKKDYRDGDVNFEDIINVLEELILYYSDPYNANKEYVSYIFRISPDLERKLLAYIKEENPHELLKQTLQKALQTISLLVHEYSRHYCSSDSRIFPKKEQDFWNGKGESRNELNDLFKKWAINLASNGSTIRSYTLNYDRLFKELIASAIENDPFEGINKSNEFDLHSILNERNVHCHFNLHGSIYWHVRDRNKFGMKDFVFTLKKEPFWETDKENLEFITIEQGRPFLLSNIVAGYRKSQRTLLSPFKQMHISFELDCSDADNIYIIGYSFSDQHINSGLRSHLLAHENSIIHIIDKKYAEMKPDEILKNLLVVDFPQLFDQTKLENGKNNFGKDLHSLLDGRVLIYPLAFEEYLRRI